MIEEEEKRTSTLRNKIKEDNQDGKISFSLQKIWIFAANIMYC